MDRELTPEAQTFERMMLDGGGELARTVRRLSGKSVSDEQYSELMMWAAWLKVQRGLSHATANNYLEAAGRYIVWLTQNDILPSTVTGKDIDRYHRDLVVTRRLGRIARSLSLSAIRSYHKWREHTGYGPSPARSVVGPRHERRMPRKYTKSQLRALFSACDKRTLRGLRDLAVLMFFYATGARRCEIAELTMDQLVLRQRSGVVRFMGKGAKERIVSFEGPAVEIMQSWLVAREHVPKLDQNAVFVATTGPRTGCGLCTRALNDLFRACVRRSKIKTEPRQALHTLRVTFATNLYDVGIDIETLAHLMGHEDIETTRGYIAISERRLQTRMPSDHLRDLLGENKNATPLWFRKKINDRGKTGVA